MKKIAEQCQNISNIEVESQERSKQISKLAGEKETLKSEIRQLKSRLESLIEKSEDEILKL